MSRLLLSCLVGLAILATGVEPARADPPIWRVRDADTEMVLFGSVHTLPEGVEWRSAALDAALALGAGPDTLEYRDARRGLLKRVAWRVEAGANFVDGLLWTDAQPGGESVLRTALGGGAWRGPRLAAFATRVSLVGNDCDDPNALVPQSMTVTLGDGRVLRAHRDAPGGA